MQSDLIVTTRRETLLNLLPSINTENAEKLLHGLSTMAARLGSKNTRDGVVLYTASLDVTVEHVRELFVGEGRDRVTVDGVHTIMVLYRGGFFTGKIMQEPKVVSRIAAHLHEQQNVA